MRMPIVVLAAIAALVPGWAEAGKKDPYNPGGGGFVDTKHPKVTKDYYVVREGQSDKCKVVTGDFGNKPVGAIGGCKGGNTDEAADDKHRKK